MPAIGDQAPTFALEDTQGLTYELDRAPATVLVFTCNHCPYSLAWHQRIVDVAKDYADRGVRMLAINPNDAERYPRDSLEAMRTRVERGDFEGVPYLRDESQSVARAYGAKTTPDVYVLDGGGVLRYRGAPGGDYDDTGFMRDAIDAVLTGAEPDPAKTKPVGCSIKWKPRWRLRRRGS
jgi:peroxiredoxin